MSVLQQSSIAGVQMIEHSDNPSAAKAVEFTCLAGTLIGVTASLLFEAVPIP